MQNSEQKLLAALVDSSQGPIVECQTDFHIDARAGVTLDAHTTDSPPRPGELSHPDGGRVSDRCVATKEASVGALSGW